MRRTHLYGEDIHKQLPRDLQDKLTISVLQDPFGLRHTVRFVYSNGEQSRYWTTVVEGGEPLSGVFIARLCVEVP